MDKLGTDRRDKAGHPRARIGAVVPGSGPTGERLVADRLSDSFPLVRSESEWLLTLLSADDLRYIFEGFDHGESRN